MSDQTRVSFFPSLFKNRTCFGLRRNKQGKTEPQINPQDLIDKACCQISTDVNGLQISELKDRNKKPPDDFKEPLNNVVSLLIGALVLIIGSFLMISIRESNYKHGQNMNPRNPAREKRFDNYSGEEHDQRSLELHPVQGTDKEGLSQERI